MFGNPKMWWWFPAILSGPCRPLKAGREAGGRPGSWDRRPARPDLRLFCQSGVKAGSDPGPALGALLGSVGFLTSSQEPGLRFVLLLQCVSRPQFRQRVCSGAPTYINNTLLFRCSPLVVLGPSPSSGCGRSGSGDVLGKGQAWPPADTGCRGLVAVGGLPGGPWATFLPSRTPRASA